MTRNEDLDEQVTKEAADRIRRLTHPPTAEIARLHIDAMVAASQRARTRRTRRLGVRLLTAAALTLGAGALALPIVNQGDERPTQEDMQRPENVSEDTTVGSVPVGAGHATAVEQGQTRVDPQNDHGRAVSQVARTTEPGPGHGKLVSQVASSKSRGHRQNGQGERGSRGKSDEDHGKAKGKDKNQAEEVRSQAPSP